MEKGIGKKFKEARVKNNMTMAEVASIIGCSVGYISRIESGSRPNINYVLYNKLIELYDLQQDKVKVAKRVERVDNLLHSLLKNKEEQNEKLIVAFEEVLFVLEDLIQSNNQHENEINSFLSTSE